MFCGKLLCFNGKSCRWSYRPLVLFILVLPLVNGIGVDQNGQSHSPIPLVALTAAATKFAEMAQNNIST